MVCRLFTEPSVNPRKAPFQVTLYLGRRVMEPILTRENEQSVDVVFLSLAVIVAGVAILVAGVFFQVDHG